MKKYSPIIKGLLLAILGMLVFPYCLLAAPDEVFDEVQELVKTNYVDPIDIDSLNVHSSRELIAELGDRFSMYLTAAEFNNFMGSIEGQYAGIGVYLDAQMQPEGIGISGIIEGSPAEAGGLKAGDVIVKVNQNTISGLDIDIVCQMLLGSAGTEVQLEVKAGEAYKNFTMVRQVINIPVVTSTLLDFNTAYIDIDSFSDQADQDLEKNIESCLKAGADKWIIDLRGNPGGYITTAIEMAGIFIGSQVATVLEERNAIVSYYPDQPEIQVDDPIIILIDENSASASEILAAALKDYRKAVLIGATTYGKGTVQEIYPLSNGDWLKLTTARFYSPMGAVINGVGVEPDLALESTHMVKAAELLLSDPEDGGEGAFELLENGHEFLIDLSLARSPQFWKAWGEISDHLQFLPAYRPAGGERYHLLTPAQLQDKAALYYPNTSIIGSIDNYNNGGDIVLYVSMESDSGWNEDNIEIRNVETGEQVGAAAEEIADHFIEIKPDTDLLPGEYWVIVETQGDGSSELTSHLLYVKS